MTKEVAKTIKDMAAGEVMSRVLNYAEPDVKIDEVINMMLSHWSYDLYKRRPGPALLENGVLKTTDLDLACFMSALADRSAVVVLPTYEGRRAKSHTEGERVLSDKNRHGKITGLSANKEVFSFSVRILDQNIIKQTDKGDQTGAFRNFMLTDLDGTFWKGWTNIEFMPTAKENDFLNDKDLWTGNTLYFKNFVHPNRWISLYGQYYFLTKVLIDRLTEEAKFCRKEVKRLEEAGLKFPAGGGGKPEWPKSTTEDSKAIAVPAFQVEVDVPSWDNEFNSFQDNQDGLLGAYKRQKFLTYKAIPQLRFATRATELAFHNKVVVEKKRTFPAWIKNAEWKDGYQQKGKRKKWSRLVLTQLLVGETGFAIRYRTYEKTERVAK